MMMRCDRCVGMHIMSFLIWGAREREVNFEERKLYVQRRPSDPVTSCITQLQVVTSYVPRTIGHG